MPLLASAIKKLKQDKKRTKVNQVYRKNFRLAVKNMRLLKSQKAFRLAVSALDKAAKKRVIHKNKASRLKSRLVRLINARPKSK